VLAIMCRIGNLHSVQRDSMCMSRCYTNKLLKLETNRWCSKFSWFVPVSYADDPEIFVEICP